MLSACAKPPKASVEERATLANQPVIVHQDGKRVALSGDSLDGEPRDATSRASAPRYNNVHIVRPQETLYSIAFARQLAVNDLVCWNQIRDIRRLQIGQELVLVKPTANIQCPDQPVSTPGAAAKPPAGSAGSDSRISSSTMSRGSSRQTQAKAKQNTKPKPDATPKTVSWQWPLEGRLLERYSTSARRQGIVIASPKASPIKAAASGTVVYHGNALKGYGNLLIVNHANGYLSAYAHTQEILVKEGQNVRAAEVIATSGVDNNNRAALHFQIRKDGNPIDPLGLLK